MQPQQKAKSGGAGKLGRCTNSSQHKAYEAEGRYDKNRKKRLKRHIRKNEAEVFKKLKRKKRRIIKIDKQAVNALKRLTA